MSELHSHLYALAKALLVLLALKTILFKPLPHVAIGLPLVAAMWWGMNSGRKAGL